MADVMGNANAARVRALYSAAEADDAPFSPWELDWIFGQHERVERCEDNDWPFRLSERNVEVLEELEGKVDG